MSREQVTEQTVQGDTATSADTTTEETYGLPSAVYAQVINLKPGNVEGLRDLLTRYPNFSQGILSVASHHLGAAAVRQAVSGGKLTQADIRPGGEFELEGSAPPRGGKLTQADIRPGGEFELEGSAPPRGGKLTQADIRPGGEFELEGSAPPRGGKLTQADIRPGGEFELEGSAPPRGGKLTQADIRPGGEFELEGSAPPRGGKLTQADIRPGGEFELEGSAPPRGGKLTQADIRPGGEFELEGEAPAPAAAEPDWVPGARKYNEAHPEMVSNFNALTGNSCIGIDGRLDPQLVSAWQRDHGLDADGKVGPHTVAAARQAGTVASSPSEARIPV